MKAKKIIAIVSVVALGASLCAFTACGKKTPTPTFPSNTTVYGLPTAATGRYISNADLVQESETTRYLVYTTNETAGDEDNVIAVRKASYEEGANKGWTYGAESIAIRGEESEWDEYIGSASIVKGTFSYNESNYTWLMAYCATTKSNDTQYQIGLAVATAPDGTWTKVGTVPVVTYDAGVYGASMAGCYAPSLINYNKTSGIRLYYTYADTYGHFATFVDFDASNLSAIDLSGKVQCPNNGEIEGGDNVSLFPNADWAYDATASKFYAVKDYSPSAATKPNFAPRIQLLYIAEAELYTAEEGDGWKSVCSWDNTDTPNAAYERLYSACIVSDAYGHVDGATGAEIVYNVCDVEADNADYLYSQNLHEFSVSLTVE